MGAPQAVVDDDFGERGVTGEPEKRGYTGPGQGRSKRGPSTRRRLKGSDISMLLRGEEPAISGFFGGVKEKEVSCLRCDKKFMSKSRENRICQPCRGGTEDLMRGSSVRRRLKGSDISMLLRGEEPAISGFFGGVKEKEVSCLRCDKPFMSKSRENRICQPCRGGTEDLMRGSLPEMGAGVSAQNNELGGGASPRSRAGGVKRKKGA